MKKLLIIGLLFTSLCCYSQNKNEKMLYLRHISDSLLNVDIDTLSDTEFEVHTIKTYVISKLIYDIEPNDKNGLNKLMYDANKLSCVALGFSTEKIDNNAVLSNPKRWNEIKK